MKRLKMISGIYRKQAEIAVTECSAIIEYTVICYFNSGEPHKLQVFIIDGSFVDIWYSVKGKYSYHWEKRMIMDEIYRYYNCPHIK